MPMRILLVEDDPNSRTALVSLLEMEGFTVDACESGYEAQARLRTAAYQALVTDLALPELGGHELIRSARELQPALRCIVVSATEQPERLGSGIHAWLMKPIDFDELTAVLLG